MLRGIFSVQFQAMGTGQGIVTIEDGKFHGGDLNYLYKGKLSYGERGTIHAEVDVCNYTGSLSSVFGPLRDFRLILDGVYSDPEHFRLSGQIKGQPQAMITIAGVKQSGLADE